LVKQIIEEMTNIICLDDKYSTTRLLTKEKPKMTNKSEDIFEFVLLLQEDEDRKGEGGLRTQGYFKKSYDDKPLISIVTVVYNGKEYLEETIQSLISQTYDNVEYIIIDGGSTDGTIDIIKKYEDQIDYWVSESDRGIYDAMNKGIILCSGEIIGLVNADDYIYKNTLKVVVETIESFQVDFVYADLDIIDCNGKKIDTISSIGLDHIRFKAFKQMPFLHPSLFVHREVYKQLGLYSTDYKLSSDYDFSLRLVNSDFIGKKIKYATGIFRLGGQSGGMETYMENHKIALKHKHNILLVYINTVILLMKMYFRNFLSRWR